MGYSRFMKTTLEISDSILAKAKELAREQNVVLRSLAEEGLTRVIEEREPRKPRRVNRRLTYEGQSSGESRSR
jgi:hypothetical protein